MIIRRDDEDNYSRVGWNLAVYVESGGDRFAGAVLLHAGFGEREQGAREDRVSAVADAGGNSGRYQFCDFVFVRE